MDKHFTSSTQVQRMEDMIFCFDAINNVMNLNPV